jgi:hypothetical protein
MTSRRRLLIGVLLVLCAQAWSATYYRTVREDVQISEATAARRTVYFDVGTHEAQTVTVSKGGGAFGATAGTAATQVDGTCYKLVIHADDIDTLGDVAFKCVGATDTQYVFGIRVVTDDPFAQSAGIADAVWEEALSGHDGTTGSVAEALLLVMQRGCGKIVTDNGDGTIKVYDTDGVSLLLTITKSTAGDEVTWTPS